MQGIQRNALLGLLAALCERLAQIKVKKTVGGGHVSNSPMFGKSNVRDFSKDWKDCDENIKIMFRGSGTKKLEAPLDRILF